jgi:hypothetical protein
VGIFRRRIIQRELDFLRETTIAPDRARDLLGKLNSPRRQAIAAEWEVVVTASLSHLAEVRYELPMGTVRPDLCVRFECDGRDIEFIADIVAVSDEQTDKRNPADFFFEEFSRVAANAGFANGGFDIRIRDLISGQYPNKSQRLLLPSKGDIPQFLKREMKAFFREIKSAPAKLHVFERNEPGVQLTITYNPSSIGHNTGGHALCAAPFSLRHNSLFCRLEEKATQLKNSGYAGLMGIIVVDGDCHSLRSTYPGAGPWSRDQIVEEFLRLHSRITFITTTHHETKGSWTNTEHKLYNKIYWQRPFDPALTSNLYPLLILRSNHCHRYALRRATPGSTSEQESTSLGVADLAGTVGPASKGFRFPPEHSLD